jgi:hypothetical protein
MAKNLIQYEGRIINTKGQSKLTKARTGKLVLVLLVAEQFQERNDKAPDEFKKIELAPDAYVNTYTAWHKLQVFGEATDPHFVALVTDPQFAHGAVVDIVASYREEKPWTDKGNRIHAGRRESIFFAKEDGGSIRIKVLDDGRVLGAREENARPFWDGRSELPGLGGTGGGGPAAPEYGDDEGF